MRGLILIGVLAAICYGSWVYAGGAATMNGAWQPWHLWSVGPDDSAACDASMKALEQHFGYKQVSYCCCTGVSTVHGLNGFENVESFVADNENSANGVYKLNYVFGPYSGNIYMYYTGSTRDFRCDGITTN